MNIVIVSYGDLDYDGRLRSLEAVFSKLGSVYSFSRGKKSPNDNSVVDNSSYEKFIFHAVHFAQNINSIDMLVLDNRKATIPGIIISKRCKPHVVIQDCRELYLLNETKHFSGKVGCIFERYMVRRADVVICANKERAQIMQKEYSLNKAPVTYENLRRLQYGSEEEIQAAKLKIDDLLHEGEFRIISSSGCSIERKNDTLVENLCRINRPCRLYLVGESSEDDERTIRKIIDKYGYENIEIVGKLNQTELKYLISQSHIGVVNYGQYDTNNKYCASGKLYEFLYEGIPVVTTSNPPLDNLCQKYGIGIADDEYYNGINEIIEEYDSIKEKVKLFVEMNTIEKNDNALLESVQKAIQFMR